MSKKVFLSLTITCMTFLFWGCDVGPAKEGEDIHGAWAYSQLFVEKRLKSPSSAKYPFGAASKGAVKHIGNDVYFVKSYVDSQNSFGATIRTNFELKIKRVDNGNSWQLVDEIKFY
ncbi:MAG: hypothetical protein V8T90_15590 [Victivallales bacterium]